MKTPLNQIDFKATSLRAGVIEYWSVDGNLVSDVKLLKLIDYIEKNNLNYEQGYISSTDENPIDAMDWLDMKDQSYLTGYRDNFEMVTELYFMDKLAEKELSHAA